MLNRFPEWEIDTVNARRAVTSQDIPPNTVLLGLSLFLSLFVMGPAVLSILDSFSKK